MESPTDAASDGGPPGVQGEDASEVDDAGAAKLKNSVLPVVG